MADGNNENDIAATVPLLTRNQHSSPELIHHWSKKKASVSTDTNSSIPLQDFHCVDIGDEPLTSSQARAKNSLDNHHKVNFIIGEEDHNGSVEKIGDRTRDKHCSGRYHRFHVYHQNKYNKDRSRTPSKQEEACNKLSFDQSELQSRRFGVAPQGLRRHLSHRPTHKRIDETNGCNDNPEKDSSRNGGLLRSTKKILDHRPHEVFVELEELVSNQWKETARWIKYEENVEQDLDRWSAPHIASLSFNDMGTLKKCLEEAVVLLDIEEHDVPSIFNHIADAAVQAGQINADQRPLVLKALLQSHHHVGEEISGPLKFLRRSSILGSGHFRHNTSATSLDAAASFRVQQKNFSMPLMNNHLNASQEIKNNAEIEAARHQAILKRIPEDSEATCVMVAGLKSLVKTAAAFVRLADSQYLPNVIEIPLPVRFIFVCIGPEEGDVDYHEIGRCMSTLMANKSFHDTAYAATGRLDLITAFNQFLGESIVLPPGDYDNRELLPVDELKKKSELIRRKQEKLRRSSKKLQEVLSCDEKSGDDKKFGDNEEFSPLRKTGRVFGGLLSEVKNRYPMYLSDIMDGLNGQCLATAIFIFFAALSGSITFGGLIGEKTNNLIGVSETLMVTFAGGIFFGLLSGQPLIIIGLTGPVLLFDELLYNLCQEQEIDFLGIRIWIAAWTVVIALIFCAFEMPTYVCYFTRFTQEIFAALISLLYLYESFGKLINIFETNPLLSLDDYTSQSADPSNVIPANIEPFNASEPYPERTQVTRNQPNTALLSFVLMFSTFFLADYFRRIKTSKFLSRGSRALMGDFAMPISIVAMVAIDYFVPNVYTQKLSVPDGLATSTQNRGWLVSPWGHYTQLEAWHMGIAAFGGVLVFILLFLEVEICQLLLSKKERKTVKGTGFHLDLLLICIMELGTACFGGPWLCAATIRCVSHLCALTVTNARVPPGEKPQVQGVREQRITGILVSILLGLSVLMGPVLRRIPIAVLFGVFLYMGYTSMLGLQLFDRLVLMFKPTKHFPPVPYAQKVGVWKMHGYTIIQLLCLGSLWAIKQSSFALAFPFGLLMMIPMRVALKFIFSKKELHLLDSDECDHLSEEDE